MARKIRKKGLKQYSKDDLLRELSERLADEKFQEGMTMSEMELAAGEMMKRDEDPPPIAAMLSRMKPEKPTAKTCPKCGKRIPVKARDQKPHHEARRANAHRMKYRLYREDGLPIGSGAVESAHRHVLQTRMKRADSGPTAPPTPPASTAPSAVPAGTRSRTRPARGAAASITATPATAPATSTAARRPQIDRPPAYPDPRSDTI